MKLEHAEILRDELSMLIEIEVYEEYSGRGMFGDTTSGVVVDSLSEFISAIGDYLSSADADEIDTVRAIGSAVKNISTDSMGMSVIIY
jgi:hypothetical protein